MSTEKIVEVLDVFHTNTGMIAILRFPAGLSPELQKTKLSRDENTWLVAGITTHAMPVEGYQKLLEEQKQNIWHCKLESETNNKVQVGERLTMASR